MEKTKSKAVTFSARTCRTLESIIVDGKTVCGHLRYRKCKREGHCNLIQFTKKDLEPGVRSTKALERCRKVKVTHTICIEETK